MLRKDQNNFSAAINIQPVEDIHERYFKNLKKKSQFG